MNARQRRKAIRIARRIAGSDWQPHDPAPWSDWDEARSWLRCWSDADREERHRRAWLARRPLCPRCMGHGLEASAPDWSCGLCIGAGTLPAPPTRKQAQRARRIAAQIREDMTR